MQSQVRWAIAIVVLSLFIAGCGTVASTGQAGPIVEPLDTGANRVTLTDIHMARLSIQFEEVMNNGGHNAAPYAVIVYDNFGGEWVYTNPKANVFERTRVEVDRVEGETVFFSEGVEAGMMLVTDGAAELLGIEFGVGE